jgi:hypothetical protein
MTDHVCLKPLLRVSLHTLVVGTELMG